MGERGLYQAWLLDGNGGGEALDWDGVRAHRRGEGLLWLDLDFSHAEARRWLQSLDHIPLPARQAMLTPETRPNIMQFTGGILIILRGANLNEGARAEDMISVRVWIDHDAIITCRQRELRSIHSIAGRLHEAAGPRSTGELLSDLAGELATRIRQVVTAMEDELDRAEAGDGDGSRPAEEMYSRLRRGAAALRRHLNPQRDALQRLQGYQGDLLGAQDQSELVVHTDTIIHSIEDLEVLREHTQALQDELFSAMSRDQNDRIYMLTIVAAIFLPLTFISGLLGMNVGGIPGSGSSWGFWGIVLLCTGIVLAIWLFFRKRRWL
jgi:zinc transporter